MNIISSYEGDFVLNRIRGAVYGEGPAEEMAKVSTIIRLQQPLRDRLDLIGHSVEQRCLQIGRWTLQSGEVLAGFLAEQSDEQPREELWQKIRALGIKRVRLLGCKTATTAESWKVIEQIGKALGSDCQVYGSTEMLWAMHFDENGFKSDFETLLRPFPDCEGPVANPLTRNSLPYAQAKDNEGKDVNLNSLVLRTEPLGSSSSGAWPQTDVTDHVARDIWNEIDPDIAWSFPGLLALPQLEIKLPLSAPLALDSPHARASGGYHRVEVLLDYEIVRVYPSGSHPEGLVYRVGRPAELKRLVTQPLQRVD